MVVGHRNRLDCTFEDIISLENLFAAWEEFIKGKRGKQDVAEFRLNLAQNIFALHDDLAIGRYLHGGYHAFNINDPKPRSIHKANVRDRLVHHAVYRVLYPLCDKRFVSDSFSCRKRKGTHKATKRFRGFAFQVSRNNTRTCFVLKCDIRKFFATIDHVILLRILRRWIADERINGLLENIITSFHVESEKGLPLGNLTSQLLVNVYMNEFDQFVKHTLHVRHYIRYADDFVLLSCDRAYLENLLPVIRKFLEERLRLTLHPYKVGMRTFQSGVDFLGWIHFPTHRVLRAATKRRMESKLKNGSPETRESYLGLLRHGDTFKLQKKILNMSFS